MKMRELESKSLANFVMKLCCLDRFIEIKRQFLCDSEDFESYVVFQRLTRNGEKGVTAQSILSFLAQNFIETKKESLSWSL